MGQFSDVELIEGLDLDALRPTLERMRRVAQTLCKCRTSDISVSQRGYCWRSGTGVGSVFTFNLPLPRIGEGRGAAPSAWTKTC